MIVRAMVGSAALLVRRRLREAAVALIVIAAPIVFFTWVPSHGRSAIFFTRYMLPALPFFLMLVAAGCVELARPLGRLRVPALVLAVAVLVGAELKEDMDHLGEIRGLHLGRTVAAVRAVGGNAILFGSTGTIGRSGDIATLSYGRPPVLLDHYVVLRDPGLRRVDDDSCVPTIAF